MIGYMITLGLLVIVLTILCGYLGINRSKINKDIERQNKELEKKLVKNQEEIKYLEQTKSTLANDINNSQSISYTAFTKYQAILEESYTKAEEEYDRLKEKLEEAYGEYQENLLKDTEQKEINYKQEIENIKQELNKLKETRAAALEAQRREELMKLEKDSYRVILTQTELTTIDMINELKPRLPEPRILCMLVWQTFYQKKLDALCKRILGSNIICGIYKITNITNNMCYIGQAVNIGR